ncbi:hypothetical protein Enr8_04830 [Blastopirellula retiformator]|uniref:Uncharacterized protein n=1 Tax=Blastopirellula retiformator TaxID=2527970 RepID=A0A5C5VM04_9BACT|nr:hypothetical protein Enr8_04830 [Blastopirellula retiformator]
MALVVSNWPFHGFSSVSRPSQVIVAYQVAAATKPIANVRQFPWPTNATISKASSSSSRREKDTGDSHERGERAVAMRVYSLL